MIKISFLLLIILATTIKAQTVNIPDVNFKAYLVGNANINTNNDSEIQISEASSFSGNLSCASLLIYDLTGIEAFINITVLNCSHNELTSLDISQNIMLEYLNCANNYIPSLIISQNTELTFIRCESNQLSSLDIASNLDLMYLYCHQNHLTSLNTSQNPALDQLLCYDNHLTSLDLSQNTLMAHLHCESNQLTELDLTNGNNIILSDLKARLNPNLSCIKVDSVAWSTANWTIQDGNIDPASNFSTDCIIGIEVTNQNKKTTSYPNPTTDIVSFTTTKQIKVIQIFNNRGEQVILSRDEKTININKLHKGIYMARLTLIDGSTISSKIIKH